MNHLNISVTVRIAIPLEFPPARAIRHLWGCGSGGKKFFRLGKGETIRAPGHTGTRAAGL
ncbi:hypothetical protein IT084_10620 [Desulfallas sp. Bu1-1]|uniref:hypothetical protein n=1 Tax=Desulfallas sp. Bu1-1 TaxID=2787620 RepID=UPI00189CF07D|nr:hypothetical protein [Desulfallas sp. Bu1-1]MBF7083425.1 hypothetical protein [Desulfallas sp. Bu1-1]